MAIIVERVLLRPESNEAKYSEEFAKVMEEYFRDFPDADGTLTVISNFRTPGQPVEDIDILLLGTFSGFVIPSFYPNDYQQSLSDLEIDNFACNIELKQSSNGGVKRVADQIRIRYKNSKSYKDGLGQSEAACHALNNYVGDKFGTTPFFHNMLWLAALENDEVETLRAGDKLQILPKCISGKSFFERLFENSRKRPYYQRDKGRYLYSAVFDKETRRIDRKIFDNIRSLAKIKIVLPPGVTRDKMKKLLRDHTNVDICSVGERMSVISGLPGTGKTFMLLLMALKLINERNARCLILTFNKSLVSDLRRLIYFLGYPAGSDGPSLGIESMESFFWDLMSDFGIIESTKRVEPQEYRDNIERWKQELLNEILENNTSENPMETQSTWDYLLVDEGQDWTEVERDIVINFFGEKNIVVADGVNQFVRGTNRLSWDNNIVSNELLKSGLRQSINLSLFANKYASRFVSNSWKININLNNQRGGGRIILTENYNSYLHNYLKIICQNGKCEDYDILMLVPPSEVNGADGFKRKAAFEKLGINIFDGTVASNRNAYPLDKNQCRLFQYESCRGLEGWVTVCLYFDKLIEYKINNCPHIPADTNRPFESNEDRVKRFAYLWSLMPITRPIDTLVIHLSSMNSEVGQFLLSCSREMEYVEYLPNMTQEIYENMINDN